MKENLIYLLEELEEYMDNKADADYETETGHIPNEEMRLRIKITDALENLKRVTDSLNKKNKQ